MSISKERKEEIRKQYVERYALFVVEEYPRGQAGFWPLMYDIADWWLDILDRELETQRERIAGEIDALIKDTTDYKEKSGLYAARDIVTLQGPSEGDNE